MCILEYVILNNNVYFIYRVWMNMSESNWYLMFCVYHKSTCAFDQYCITCAIREVCMHPTRKHQKPKEHQKDMNACDINRNVNNSIEKKSIINTHHWKKVKCDSEIYVIMVCSTWGNCVPDTIQYVILCKFNHEAILSCIDLTMQTIGTTEGIALKKNLWFGH